MPTRLSWDVAFSFLCISSSVRFWNLGLVAVRWHLHEISSEFLIVANGGLWLKLEPLKVVLIVGF